MNFKKIIAGAVVGAMAVSAMAVSAFADDTKTDLNLKMVVMVDGISFDEYPKTDAVNVSKDGTYTFKLDNLDVALSNLQTLYVKDAYAVDNDGNLEEGYKSSLAEGFSVESFALKINGKDVAIDDAFYDDMGDGDVFDYCLYNIWAKNYITISDDTINSVEIVATIVSGNGDAVLGNTDASESGSSPVGDPGATTPDKNQPNTGVEGIAVVAALAVVSTGAVVIAKKRK